MKKINYILAISFIVVWVFGFFGEAGGNQIHLLLVAALGILLKNVISEATGTSSKREYKRKSEYAITNLLDVLAVVLIISWAIGFFAYNAGNLIHILLAIALIAIVLKIIRNREAM